MHPSKRRCLGQALGKLKATAQAQANNAHSSQLWTANNKVMQLGPVVGSPQRRPLRQCQLEQRRRQLQHSQELAPLQRRRRSSRLQAPPVAGPANLRAPMASPSSRAPHHSWPVASTTSAGLKLTTTRPSPISSSHPSRLSEASDGSGTGPILAPQHHQYPATWAQPHNSTKMTSVAPVQQPSPTNATTTTTTTTTTATSITKDPKNSPKPQYDIQMVTCTTERSTVSMIEQHTLLERIKSQSIPFQWNWDSEDASHQCIVSDDKLELCFHPDCSESTAAIRGSEALKRNGNSYYWEVVVYEKAYGTSVMFGICTKEQKLHLNDYRNLIGLDKFGWSLSHKGHIWHSGILSEYAEHFPFNGSVTVGVLFDSYRGELSFVVNGKNLGVAFSGLNYIDDDLFPVVGTTARRTRMRLLNSVQLANYRCFSLLDGSYMALLRHVSDRSQLVELLTHYGLPKVLLDKIADQLSIQRYKKIMEPKMLMENPDESQPTN